MHRKYVASLIWTYTKIMNGTQSDHGPSITRNLITRVLTIYRVKLTQSKALGQKRLDLRSLSPAPLVTTCLIILLK